MNDIWAKFPSEWIVIKCPIQYPGRALHIPPPPHPHFGKPLIGALHVNPARNLGIVVYNSVLYSGCWSSANSNIAFFVIIIWLLFSLMLFWLRGNMPNLLAHWYRVVLENIWLKFHTIDRLTFIWSTSKGGERGVLQIQVI